jgi:hypothetical protein
MIDRHLCRSIIIEDGLIEWLTVGCATLASLFSLARAWRLRKSRQRYWGWLLLSALCFIFAGEELDWGRRIFGWQAPVVLGEKPSIFHDWVKLVGWRFLGKAIRNRPRWIGAGAIIAVGLCGALGVWIFQQWARVASWWRNVQRSSPETFVFLGLSLLFVASGLDILYDFAPDVLGVTSLEEALELLSALAFLFAALLKGPGSLRTGNGIGTGERV